MILKWNIPVWISDSQLAEDAAERDGSGGSDGQLSAVGDAGRHDGGRGQEDKPDRQLPPADHDTGGEEPLTSLVDAYI